MFLPLITHLTWFKPLVPIMKITFNRYHAKVLSSEDTRKIFELNQDISVISESNKQIIPYKNAYKIIFQEPEFIAVMDCPCKLSKKAPADEINSCIAVGKGTASFWIEHCQKYNARKITQKEALELIERLRKKNHITQAFFKVSTGGCTGVICNCHPDTCAALQATHYFSQLDNSLSMTAESGYAVHYDGEKCNNCGKCATVCHFGAIELNNDHFDYNKNNCMGCELCVENCPQNALALYVAPGKPLPLDLDKIMERATGTNT